MSTTPPPLALYNDQLVTVVSQGAKNSTIKLPDGTTAVVKPTDLQPVPNWPTKLNFP